MLTWLAAHYDDDYKDVAFTIILRDQAWNAMLRDKTVIHTPDSLSDQTGDNSSHRIYQRALKASVKIL